MAVHHGTSRKVNTAALKDACLVAETLSGSLCPGKLLSRTLCHEGKMGHLVHP